MMTCTGMSQWTPLSYTFGMTCMIPRCDHRACSFNNLEYAKCPVPGVNATLFTSRVCVYNEKAVDNCGCSVVLFSDRLACFFKAPLCLICSSWLVVFAVITISAS